MDESLPPSQIRPQDVDQANAIYMQRDDEVYASVESKELQTQFDEIVKTRPPSMRDLPEDSLKATIDRAKKKLAGENVEYLTGRNVTVLGSFTAIYGCCPMRRNLLKAVNFIVIRIT